MVLQYVIKGLQTTFCRQITFWCGQDLGGGHPHVESVDGLFVTNDARSLESSGVGLMIKGVNFLWFHNI